MQEDRYVQTIRELLHKKRFDHSLNVAQRAVELAKRYGEDEQKAYIAGILHDICKNMQPEEQLQWMKKSAIILDENLLEQPPVWHGFAGAEYIRHGGACGDEQAGADHLPCGPDQQRARLPGRRTDAPAVGPLFAGRNA